MAFASWSSIVTLLDAFNGANPRPFTLPDEVLSKLKPPPPGMEDDDGERASQDELFARLGLSRDAQWGASVTGYQFEEATRRPVFFMHSSGQLLPTDHEVTDDGEIVPAGENPPGKLEIEAAKLRLVTKHTAPNGLELPIYSLDNSGTPVPIQSIGHLSTAGWGKQKMAQGQSLAAFQDQIQRDATAMLQSSAQAELAKHEKQHRSMQEEVRTQVQGEIHAELQHAASAADREVAEFHSVPPYLDSIVISRESQHWAVAIQQ